MYQRRLCDIKNPIKILKSRERDYKYYYSAKIEKNHNCTSPLITNSDLQFAGTIKTNVSQRET